MKSLEGLFFLKDVSLLIIAATLFALIAGKLKQPLILGYVIAGMLILPLNLVKDPNTVKIFSDLGIAFLLFIIGLELDFNSIRQLGIKSSIIGIFQVATTFLIGLIISVFILKFDFILSVYIALIVSFSSTMVVAKLLGEQMELESVHGSLVLVVLIIQDIIAIIALSMITMGSNMSGSIQIAAIGILVLKGFILIASSYILYKILPFFLKEAVHSAELIFISSLTTMFLFSAIASFLGYSYSIGAFIAGVALSTTKFSHEITGRVKPLKDFFIVLLFVTLGMSMVLDQFQKAIFPLAIILLTVLIIKPILIFIIVKKFGYSNRTSFFTGVQLAQVGEFSLVLAAQGIAMNHIKDPSTFSMIIVATITTMILTSYIIKYDDTLYNKYFSGLLNRLGKESRKERFNIKERMKNHIIIFGLHRMSEKIISGLSKKRKKFIVVDHNPEKINVLADRGINCICSDMTNLEIYDQINSSQAKIIISVVHNTASNLTLIKKVKQEKHKAILMVASNSEEEAIRLYDEGADFVIIPQILGGEKVINYIEHLKPSEIKSWGQHYLDEIKSRQKSH
ncbi:cation:proton antiporter [Candidatus Woesearchaeota archaeon]|nr:cation:proton antiporter [Candidatus Woesearchaeota archaeon]